MSLFKNYNYFTKYFLPQVKYNYIIIIMVRNDRYFKYNFFYIHTDLKIYVQKYFKLTRKINTRVIEYAK